MSKMEHRSLVARFCVTIRLMRKDPRTGLPELDNTFSDKIVLLALAKHGKPLSIAEGPLRMGVAPSCDKGQFHSLVGPGTPMASAKHICTKPLARQIHPEAFGLVWRYCE